MTPRTSRWPQTLALRRRQEAPRVLPLQVEMLRALPGNEGSTVRQVHAVLVTDKMGRGHQYRISRWQHRLDFWHVCSKRLAQAATHSCG